VSSRSSARPPSFLILTELHPRPTQIPDQVLLSLEAVSKIETSHSFVLLLSRPFWSILQFRFPYSILGAVRILASPAVAQTRRNFPPSPFYFLRLPTPSTVSILAIPNCFVYSHDLGLDRPFSRVRGDRLSWFSLVIFNNVSTYNAVPRASLPRPCATAGTIQHRARDGCQACCASEAAALNLAVSCIKYRSRLMLLILVLQLPATSFMIAS
jgi:hypothetical protein